MAYGENEQVKMLELLKQRGSQGAIGKELSAFFPDVLKSVPVLQRMLKTGAAVRDSSQRPAKWYFPGFQPQGVDVTHKALTTRTPKAPKVPASIRKKEELINQIASDLRSFRPGYADRGDVNKENNGAWVDFRHLGRWIDDEESSYEYEDPDSDSYDPSWREDNDNRIWAPGEYKKYFKIFKEWARRYPWYNKVELDLSTSEKDWCEFSVRLKRALSESEILKEGFYEDYVIWQKDMEVNSNNGPVKVKKGEFWKYDKKPFKDFAIKGSFPHFIAVDLDNYKYQEDYEVKEIKHAG